MSGDHGHVNALRLFDAVGMSEVFGFQMGRSSGSLTRVCAAAGEVGLLLHRSCEIGHHFVTDRKIR